MQSTPDKNIFSPTRTSDSPAHAKSIRSDTIGIRQQIRTIAKTLVENHKKWEAAHRRGIVLCTAIEKCKKHAIQSFHNTDTAPAERTLYPSELKTFCDKLRIITTIFEDVRDDANVSKSNINSLLKLGATNVFDESRIVFKTWTCERVERVLNEICTRYENEYQTKVIVMQNIAHSKTYEDLVLNSSVWEFQCFIDSDMELMMAGLVTEAGIEPETSTK